MHDTSAFANPCASESAASRATRGMRVLRPLPRILARLGMQLERPPAQVPDCEMRLFAPGALICAASATRGECFVVCRGLALRRGPDGEVRPAIAVAGPDEVLASALASSLAMRVPDAEAAARQLQAEGLLTLRDGVPTAIGVRACQESP